MTSDIVLVFSVTLFDESFFLLIDSPSRSLDSWSQLSSSWLPMLSNSWNKITQIPQIVYRIILIRQVVAASCNYELLSNKRYFIEHAFHNCKLTELSGVVFELFQSPFVWSEETCLVFFFNSLLSINKLDKHWINVNKYASQ